MNYTDDPDYLLVKNIRTGEHSGSFDLLVEKYEDKVFNFCYRFLGNKDDASDCAQEVFIKVFEHLNSFRFRSSFSTWLYKIMLNSCRDMANVRNKKQKSVINTDFSASYEKTCSPAEPVSNSPDTLMTREEINIAFQKALEKLKEISRTVLIMRDIEGKSYEEISCITGLKPGTVRSTLARARYQVANELKIFRYEL